MNTINLNFNDFASLQQGMFRNIFDNIITLNADAVAIEEPKKLKKVNKNSMTKTPLSSIVKGYGSKVSKELRFTPIYKAKRKNLEAIIDRIKGVLPASSDKPKKSQNNVFKTPVKKPVKRLEKSLSKSVPAKRPRGRPRKKQHVENENISV
jgi:hypothetical protein